MCKFKVSVTMFDGIELFISPNGVATILGRGNHDE